MTHNESGWTPKDYPGWPPLSVEQRKGMVALGTRPVYKVLPSNGLGRKVIDHMTGFAILITDLDGNLIMAHPNVKLVETEANSEEGTTSMTFQLRPREGLSVGTVRDDSTGKMVPPWNFESLLESTRQDEYYCRFPDGATTPIFRDKAHAQDWAKWYNDSHREQVELMVKGTVTRHAKLVL